LSSTLPARAASPGWRFIRGLALAALLLAGHPSFAADEAQALDESVRVRFLGLLVGYPDAPALALEWLDANWRDEFVPMALEIVRFIPQRSTARALLALVARETGEKDLGDDWSAWMRRQWARTAPPPSFAAFKAAVHSNIDPRFERYFATSYPALIECGQLV